MNAPLREKHTPDPMCCGCGLGPRRIQKGNDVLRLAIVVLLLLPAVLGLSGCDRIQGGRRYDEARQIDAGNQHRLV